MLLSVYLPIISDGFVCVVFGHFFTQKTKQINLNNQLK